MASSSSSLGHDLHHRADRDDAGPDADAPLRQLLTARRVQLKPMAEHFLAALRQRCLGDDEAVQWAAGMLQAWVNAAVSAADVRRRYVRCAARRRDREAGHSDAVDHFWQLLTARNADDDEDGGGAGSAGETPGKETVNMAARMAADYCKVHPEVRLTLRHLDKARSAVDLQGLAGDGEDVDEEDRDAFAVDLLLSVAARFAPRK